VTTMHAKRWNYEIGRGSVSQRELASVESEQNSHKNRRGVIGRSGEHHLIDGGLEHSPIELDTDPAVHG